MRPNMRSLQARTTQAEEQRPQEAHVQGPGLARLRRSQTGMGQNVIFGVN